MARRPALQEDLFSMSPRRGREPGRDITPVRDGAKRRTAKRPGLKKEPRAAKAAASRRKKKEGASGSTVPPSPAKTAGGEERGGRRAEGRTAQELASRQRAISVSEFFLKNRHLLGFDNPAKALLTTVKEAVDNALDACEEAHTLPDLQITIKQLREDRFHVAVEDNGPGIVRTQVPRIFGQLLYGSKFHTLRQARGQQGIGISAAGMYAQLTTGRPMIITTRPGRGRQAHRVQVQIDTRRNVPVVMHDEEVDWENPRGTRVELEIQATYKRGRRSVDDYIEQTALVNPHACIRYTPPRDQPVEYARLTEDLPREAKEIKPHPHGVELGALLKLLRDTKARQLGSFLMSEFSRVSPRTTAEICRRAGLSADISPRSVVRHSAEKLHHALGETKLMAPPTNCLSPLGEETMIAGLRRRVPADFYTGVSRPPAVYRGNPFLVEVALAHGSSELDAGEPMLLMRFANRVPLLYQQSACVITRGVVNTSWKNYGLTQARGALPLGPMALVVHIASAWVPFTSESKEAVAHYPEIVREVTLALQACGRRLGVHLSKRRRAAEAERKHAFLEKYIPHVGIALREMLGLSAAQESKVVEKLRDTLARSRR